MRLIVRRAKIEDADVIAKNVVAMALEGSQSKLDPAIVAQGVKSLFKKPDLGFYVVAEKEGQIVGSLIVVHEWSDWRNGVHWWIHSVYIAPAFRRQGVYKEMYAFVRSEAKKSPDARELKLSTARNNHVARSTYERLGMQEVDNVIYRAT